MFCCCRCHAPWLLWQSTLMSNLTRLIRLRGRLFTPPSAALSISWGAGEFCYAVSCSDKTIATVGLGWASGDTNGA